MEFKLTEKQASDAWQFSQDHKHRAPTNWSENRCPIKYEGAIGGALTYKFTPTNAGTVVGVVCECGEEYDLTDYSEW